MIYVEHWFNEATNISISPDSSQVKAFQCYGCSLHRPHLNPVKFTSNSKNFPCITPYFSALAVVIPKTKRLNDKEYILRSSLFAIKQQVIDLHNNKYQQLEYKHNLLFNINEHSPDHEEQSNAPKDPIAYIQTPALQQQLARFRDKFTNRNTLEFYTDGSLDTSPLVDVLMGRAWIESNDPYKDQCTFTCKDFASSSCAEAFTIMAALVIAPYKCHVTICRDVNGPVRSGLGPVLNRSYWTIGPRTDLRTGTDRSYRTAVL